MSNLFARDEMDEILQELVPVMKKQFPRRPPSNENLYDYYMSRVKYNLHVALCFSPVSFHKNNKNICMTNISIVDHLQNTIHYFFRLAKSSGVVP